MNFLAHLFLSIATFFGYHAPTQAPVQLSTQPPSIVQQAPVQAPVLGSFYPVQSQKFTLAGSGVTNSATTIIVSSLLLPDAATPITMSMFGSTIGYATIEPGTTKEENISFTGITQNANNTATFTGVSRGLAFSTPYTASTTLSYAHAGGSYMIFSNSAPFYSQFGKLANNEVVTGQWTFNTFPITPATASGTESAQGGVQLATGAQAAAGTMSGSTGGRLVLPTAISTSTWISGVGLGEILTTKATGFIDPNFLAQTTASSTALETDGNGNVVWGNYNIGINTEGSYPRQASIAQATTTLMSATIPANLLGNTGLIHGLVMAENSEAINSSFEVGYGGATTTLFSAPNTPNSPVLTVHGPYTIEFRIQNTSTTTQLITAIISTSTMMMATSSASVNTTIAQKLYVTTYSNTGAGVGSASMGEVDVLRK